MHIIKVENLTKKFKDFTAVDQINFTVEKGEIFGFLGPNGAGKSTTISMLSTLLLPTSGKASINEYNIQTQTNDVRKSIGLVFQDPSLDDKLTAEENLRFHARLYDVPKEKYEARLEEVLKLVDLWDRKNDRINIFSGGMKRRLEIARGLIHYPAVLFLDEPTIGLDPQTRSHLWEYILTLKKEKQMTIFMTTHYMNEAEYCDRIAIIDNGKIVAIDTPANLKRSIGGDIITINTSENEKLQKELAGLKDIVFKHVNGEWVLEVKDGESFLPHLLQQITTPIQNVTLRKPSLDDVFLKLTGRKIREEDASDTDKMRSMMKMRRGH
ncbi:ATP-binding cassette domain-containing protein [Patescibacteria group bacterium]|nr:ATP-binding cassette domain-containing protein [Patescibacteria group bacterium]